MLAEVLGARERRYRRLWIASRGEQVKGEGIGGDSGEHGHESGTAVSGGRDGLGLSTGSLVFMPLSLALQIHMVRSS